VIIRVAGPFIELDTGAQGTPDTWNSPTLRDS
jgi:hypothetical protein